MMEWAVVLLSLGASASALWIAWRKAWARRKSNRRAFPPRDVLAKVPAFTGRKGLRKLKASPDEIAELRAQVEQLTARIDPPVAYTPVGPPTPPRPAPVESEYDRETRRIRERRLAQRISSDAGQELHTRWRRVQRPSATEARTATKMLQDRRRAQSDRDEAETRARNLREGQAAQREDEAMMDRMCAPRNRQ